MKTFLFAILIICFVGAQATIPELAQRSSSKNRIVLGFPAKPKQFPWQVSLNGYNSDGNRGICGGSVISPDWILTAAHCVTGKVRMEVLLGSIVRDQPELRLESETFFHHANYKPLLLENDVALIRLPYSINYTENILPIALPPRQFSDELFVNAKAVVSGFGRINDSPGSTVSPTLNWANIRIITNQRCNESYSDEREYEDIYDSTICGVGFDFDNQSTCNGDSGGPLVLRQDNDIPIQIGVVSFVSNYGCASGNPSGYARITKFLDWIEDNSGVTSP
uniref:Putative trypsin n=1 Tax=Corethrella appendiculata TaxID=1370023 RepID=U5EUF2_9DIPT